MTSSSSDHPEVRARWWMPVPHALALSSEVRLVSRAAFGIYAQLLLEAHARGVEHIPYSARRDGPETLAAMAVRRGDAPDEPSIHDDVKALVDEGWIVFDDDARVVQLLRGFEASRALGDECSSDPLSPPPTPRIASRPATLPPARATSATVLPPPSDVPTSKRARKGTQSPAAILRNARFYFAHRETKPRAPWKTVPADVTWEAWLASPEGIAWQTAQGLLGAPVEMNALQSVTFATPATVTDGVATPPTESVAEVRNGVASTVAESRNAYEAPVATGGVAEVRNASQRLATPLQEFATPLATPRNAVATPPLTLPSEKKQKDTSTNQGVVGVAEAGARPCNGVANSATLATPESVATAGNASQRSTPVATPSEPATPKAATVPHRNAWTTNGPITGCDLDVLVKKALKERFVPIGFGEYLTWDLLIERVSERWGAERGETVTREHWVAFIDWLAKGGDDGRGGMAWWSRGKPRMEWFTRKNNLEEKFDEAMAWWPERRRRLEQEERAKLDAARPAAGNQPAPISPEERAAVSAKAANAVAQLKAAAKAHRAPTGSFIGNVSPITRGSPA